LTRNLAALTKILQEPRLADQRRKRITVGTRANLAVALDGKGKSDGEKP